MLVLKNGIRISAAETRYYSAAQILTLGNRSLHIQEATPRESILGLQLAKWQPNRGTFPDCPRGIREK